jgi:hypothetical protein
MAYKKSPFKMSGKSPFMKALVGKQGNLPMHLQEEIKASPAKQTKSQLEEYRSKNDYLNPKVKKRKNVSDAQVIKEMESEESTMGRAKFKTKADVKAVKSMQALGGGSKYDDLIEQKAIERFKKSPVKQKVNREDGVQVKEVPRVVGEEVGKATKFVGKEAKKVGKWFNKITKKIGNATIKKSDKQKLEALEKKVAEKKTKSPAKKYGKSPAKKKGCSKKY